MIAIITVDALMENAFVYMDGRDPTAISNSALTTAIIKDPAKMGSVSATVDIKARLVNLLNARITATVGESVIFKRERVFVRMAILEMAVRRQTVPKIAAETVCAKLMDSVCAMRALKERTVAKEHAPMDAQVILFIFFSFIL
jgi:hypothetical protein